MKIRSRNLSLAFGLLIATSGCGGHSENPGPFEMFSFEKDLEGWRARGLDVTQEQPGGPQEIPWHIVRSTGQASQGSTSLELYFFNKTDAAKIWIERSFDLAPNADYDYEVHFDFYAPRNGFDSNRLFAAAQSVPPQIRDEIVAAVIGGTTDGITPEQPWAARQVRGRVHADAAGRAVVFIGAWGTFEIPYTYYLDNLRIRFKLISGRPGIGPTSPGREQ